MFNNKNLPNAALILENGDVFYGTGIGKKGKIIGEICFNTAMSGYQEAITDPSYASQILMFTFPHIGITGINDQDLESRKIFLNGLVFRSVSTDFSSWRASSQLEEWLKKNNVIGISDVNTRNLTAIIRNNGALRATLINGINKKTNLSEELKKTKEWNGIENQDLASTVTCKKPYVYKSRGKNKKFIDIVAMDFGCKNNILEILDENKFRITVVPCNFSYEQITKYKPFGVFLSNGPGDPFATYKNVGETINEIIQNNIPLFGICLGHQLIGLALKANTVKMHHGHHGVNQPVKNLHNNKIEITSQNHGFAIDKKSLPKNTVVSHTSLFDNVIQGIEHKTKPIFGVQYHPESSPGPHDSRYLFQKFKNMIIKNN